MVILRMRSRSLANDSQRRISALDARRSQLHLYKLSSRPELPIPEGDEMRSGGTLRLVGNP